VNLHDHGCHAVSGDERVVSSEGQANTEGKQGSVLCGRGELDGMITREEALAELIRRMYRMHPLPFGMRTGKYSPLA
jgi:hypothetical protein